MFAADEQTAAVLLIGEIGGTDEEVAAEYIQRSFKKPGVRVHLGAIGALEEADGGTPGAIISASMGTPQAKVAAFEAAGVPVANTLAEMVQAAKDRP